MTNPENWVRPFAGRVAEWGDQQAHDNAEAILTRQSDLVAPSPVWSGGDDGR